MVGRQRDRNRRGSDAEMAGDEYVVDTLLRHVGGIGEARTNRSRPPVVQPLEQRQDLAEFPAVGSWECIITDHEVIGAESM